jgi:hypothetical protein
MCQVPAVGPFLQPRADVDVDANDRWEAADAQVLYEVGPRN